MRPGQVVEEQVVRRRSGVVARLIRRLLVQRDDENLRKDHSMTTWGQVHQPTGAKCKCTGTQCLA